MPDFDVLIAGAGRQGNFKALRSGVFASYAIGDRLLHEDERGLARYRKFIADEFAGYCATLRDYYAQERRFAGHSFWRRRLDTQAGPAAPDAARAQWTLPRCTSTGTQLNSDITPAT